MLQPVLLAEHPYSHHGLGVSPNGLHVVSMLRHATSYTVCAAQSVCIMSACESQRLAKCEFLCAQSAHALCRLGLNVRSMQLNEMAPGLEARLPPTDTRWRRDLRALETGDYAEAGRHPLGRPYRHSHPQHMLRIRRWMQPDHSA